MPAIRPGREELLAVALAAGKSVTDAAKAANLSETTAYMRLRNPEFVARVDELRGGMVAAAVGKLSDAMAAAADKLRELLGSQSETVALRAATAIIDLGFKAVELHEMRRQIDALAEKLGVEE